ncbi:MAG: oxygen-dependent coproporphyrinogen oxidase [Bacteroidia bacterium]|nr:oxygen-dependent coproporphyrinogen oxidase [Bacteroidia bacterium]
MVETINGNTSLDEIVAFFKNLQDEICGGLEELDGKAKFQQDLWNRDGGGGGRTRLIQDGLVFEKGGVNFSHVHGKMPEKISKALKLPEEVEFHASGVSIVIHPSSPRVPIIHMNVRYFETSNGTHWFGGGIDLTPIYVIREDAVFFHEKMKAVCDKFDSNYYPEFKSWADRYFFLKHRNESRGIGGIFFDHLKADSPEMKTQNFEFVKSVGQAFLPVYEEIVNRHKDEAFGEREKDWQLLRRSRYVEFNLVWDRGTKFGLDTNGRTESILMSMPPLAKWVYNHQTEEGSQEAYTLSQLTAQDWLN